MNVPLTQAGTVPDEQLWRLSRQGDRDAFGQIVARYQALVSSVAFSACGSLAGSEDVAQETFIAAWRRLGDLREPDKLRNWLCGIARNLAANSVRRDLRRGGAPAPLDAITEKASPAEDPAAQAVTREEETLLWRALAGMQPKYREPMVLFYREHQSVAEVASGLDLSEEVVRQRLSRGRAMLREEMTAVVESTLTRTRPTAAFTAGVLSALPLASAPKVSAAAVAELAGGKAVTAASKRLLGGAGMGIFLGPVIGLIVSWVSAKAAASTARSEPERICIVRHAWRMVIFCFAMSIGLAAVLTQAGKLYPVSTIGIVLGVLTWVAALVLTILWASSRMRAKIMQIRAETGTEDAPQINADGSAAHPK